MRTNSLKTQPFRLKPFDLSLISKKGNEHQPRPLPPPALVATNIPSSQNSAPQVAPIGQFLASPQAVSGVVARDDPGPLLFGGRQQIFGEVAVLLDESMPTEQEQESEESGPGEEMGEQQLCKRLLSVQVRLDKLRGGSTAEYVRLVNEQRALQSKMSEYTGEDLAQTRPN